MNDVSISVGDAAPPDAIETIRAGLSGFNEAEVGPAERRDLFVVTRDEQGRMVGGIIAYTGWGWLFTQWLWIDEAHRGQGLAAKLLAAAEAEARARGCHSAWIDTFNPKALSAYRKAGYTVFGELPNFVAGRTRSFLSRTL
jgi:GNAT superfamily N-acetyltransferase